MATSYVTALVEITTKQYQLYKDHIETDPILSAQIRHYWKDLGFDFPGVEEAWSAVFVSWCVMKAGATSAEFKFNPQHSQFVFKAIKNRKDGIGVFRGYDFNEVEPGLGDIVQNNRLGKKYDYAYAGAHPDYFSHSAIVVDKGTDSKGPFITTIGGNESNSVRTKRISLGADGKIIKREKEPFICLIKDLK
jgi:hypothetical protein